MWSIGYKQSSRVYVREEGKVACTSKEMSLLHACPVNVSIIGPIGRSKTIFSWSSLDPPHAGFGCRRDTCYVKNTFINISYQFFFSLSRYLTHIQTY